MGNFNTTAQSKNSIDHTTFLEALFNKVLSYRFGEKSHFEPIHLGEELEDLLDLITHVSEKDKEYVLKIAELGRHAQMTDFPQQVLALSYNLEKFKGENFADAQGKNLLSVYSDQIIQTAKDVNSILSTHFSYFGDRPLSSQMKKHLKIKLESLNEKQLSKGLDIGKYKSLRDSIKLLHPRPSTPEMAAFYRKVIQNKVRSSKYTEQVPTAPTIAGQLRKDSTKANDLLIQAIKNANLQSLLDHIGKLASIGLFEKNYDLLDNCIAKITSKKSVLSSKLLPFRFYMAYNSLTNLPITLAVSRLKEAVEIAMDLSIENTSELSGQSAYLIDYSYPMQNNLPSNIDSISSGDFSVILGAIAFKKGYGDLFVFGENCHRINVSKRDTIISILEHIKLLPNLGAGKNLTEALDTIEGFANKRNLKYDNLILFSDSDDIHEELPSELFNNLWINNLCGDSFSVAKNDIINKFIVTGFTEKIVDLISFYDSFKTRDIRGIIDATLNNARKNHVIEIEKGGL